MEKENKSGCPLCGSKNIFTIEQLRCQEINEYYLSRFGISNALDMDIIEYVHCGDCDLRFFDPMITGNEKFYQDLQRFEWYYMSDKPEFVLAKRYLPLSGLVLEVGAGKAAFSEFVGKERYVGLEYNDDAIQRADNAGIKLFKESIEDHATVKSNLYSAVVSFQVLEHVPNPAVFIKGCLDALKVGGHLILAVPNHGGLCGLAQNSLLDLPPHHVSHWTEKTLRHIEKLYQLELVAIEQEEISEFHLEWAKKSKIESDLRKFLGMRSTLLDTSCYGKLISSISVIISKTINQELNTIPGHTIISCYKKK